ncbi:MAG: type 2 isopentenyl-diphosphate Delta-isomerase [Desulfurococcales archaeon]|nr:type 2 isopentenyl-diphosphate Delta-isomerase [Desulfurococcales archaeon]
MEKNTNGIITKNRKLDHIKISVEQMVESSQNTLLNGVFVEHISLPEVDLSDIDTSLVFLGKKINAPLIITGMTGGHPDTYEINRDLAIVASKHGIALGVGSQRAAIEDPSLSYTFKVAREYAPDIPLIANLGAPQLVKGYGIKEVLEAVQMIEADGIAIHLNPLQESFQPEGDTDYKGVIEKIVEINDQSPVPVIVKETGTGLSSNVVYQLYRLGIRYFDVSGLGGTNWGKVEALRAVNRGIKGLGEKLDGYGDEWGNPTAYSVIASRLSAPLSTIIASGGIRTGLDIVRSIVLGADLGGFALPALRVLMKRGVDGLSHFIDSIIYQIRVGMYLTGSSDLSSLRCKGFTITSPMLRSLTGDIAAFDYYRVKCTNVLRVPRGWTL